MSSQWKRDEREKGRESEVRERERERQVLFFSFSLSLSLSSLSLDRLTKALLLSSLFFARLSLLSQRTTR